MRVLANIETELGESLRILHDDGFEGGIFIASLLNNLLIYCDAFLSAKTDLDNEIEAWINVLSKDDQMVFCKIILRMESATVFGHWDYKEDEYEWFTKRAPLMKMTKGEFEKSLQRVNNAWTDIHTMLEMAEQLLKFTKNEQLQETWWYHPEDTVKDLNALKNTLKFLEARGNRKVRIRFE